MINEAEKELIVRFVIKCKQDRYLGFLSRAASRHKFNRELFHFRDLNWELFRQIPGSENEKETVAEEVRKSRASVCYVISVSPEHDGRYVPVAEVIKDVIGTEGTILIFGDADLIYYEGEAPGRRYISI